MFLKRPPIPARQALRPRIPPLMTTVYRYGPLAWCWRILIAAALAGGAAGLYLAVTAAAPILALMGAIVAVPALFLGLVVAASIARAADGTMVVRSLVFTRRTVARAHLRRARVRRFAQGTVSPVYAPRAWVPLRGRLPVYIDLLADIPDPKAFAAWWGVPARELPGSRDRPSPESSPAPPA